MSNSYSISEGKLSRCDAEAVAPGPGEVAVEIQASSINYRDLGIQAQGRGLCHSPMGRVR